MGCSSDVVGKAAFLIDQVIKCKPGEFWVVGDVVKASYDLQYETGCVKKGVLGKIMKNTDPYEVDWTPHAVGKAAFLNYQVIKCEPHEFLVVGDVVKASYDLQYEAGV